jgi:hypothetical protein
MKSYIDFYNFSLQDPVTPIAYGIIKLHDHILFFMLLITFIVVYLLLSTYYNFKLLSSLDPFLSKKNSVYIFFISSGTFYKFEELTIFYISTLLPSHVKS